jgi:hypothetical protein
MPRRSSQDDPRAIRQRLGDLLAQLDAALDGDSLRSQVRALIPVDLALRDLGSSLLPSSAPSARKRILYYMQGHVGIPLSGDELRIVAGIDDWGRRVRELRVDGWPILSGVTLSEMPDEDAAAILIELGVAYLDDEEYVLLGHHPELEHS